MSRPTQVGAGNPRRSRRQKALLTVREIAVFAMLGAIMTAADAVMNIIPNVHLGGMLIVVYTLVYRAKALFPIYVYVLLIGLYEGIGMWWVPYLYIWAVLWGAVMLLPKHMPKWLAPVVYTLVCGLHGFAFGLLWAPFEMLHMSFSWEQIAVWWKFGFLTADIPHGIGNLVASVLIMPLTDLIRRLDRRAVS